MTSRLIDPKAIGAHFLRRLPLMLLSFVTASVLHFYWMVWVNEGFDGSQSWVAPYINVDQNGRSATVIFTVVSGLFWSFVISLVKAGPAQTFNTLARAPGQFVERLRQSGPKGLAALAIGSGMAAFGAGLLALNGPAKLSLALGGGLLALTGPGRWLAGLLLRALPKLVGAAGAKAGVDLSLLQTVLGGLGPGFLVAAVFPSGLAVFAGAGLVVTGVGLFAAGSGGGTAGPRAAGAGSMLVTAFWGGLGCAVFSLLCPDDAWAHDLGASENGGLQGVLRSPRLGEGVVRGLGPGIGGFVGGGMPPLAETPDRPIERPAEHPTRPVPPPATAPPAEAPTEGAPPPPASTWTTVVGGKEAEDILKDSGLVKEVTLPDGTKALVEDPPGSLDGLQGNPVEIGLGESPGDPDLEKKAPADVIGIGFERGPNGEIKNPAVVIEIGEEGEWEEQDGGDADEGNPTDAGSTGPDESGDDPGAADEAPEPSESPPDDEEPEPTSKTVPPVAPEELEEPDEPEEPDDSGEDEAPDDETPEEEEDDGTVEEEEDDGDDDEDDDGGEEEGEDEDEPERCSQCGAVLTPGEPCGTCGHDPADDADEGDSDEEEGDEEEADDGDGESDDEEGDSDDGPHEEDLFNPPDDDRKRQMWEDEGVVWDPETGEWRPPKKGEAVPVPLPDDATDLEKRVPRHEVPKKCRGLYDRLNANTRRFRELNAEVEAAKAGYDEAHKHLLFQLTKAHLVLAQETAGIVGAGGDMVHGAGKGLRQATGAGGPTGLKTGMPPGKLRQAWNATKDKVAALTNKVGKLTTELAEATSAAAKKSSVVQGLRSSLEKARGKVRDLGGAVRRGEKYADDLARAERAAEDAAGKIENLERSLDNLRKAEPHWDELQGAEAKIEELLELDRQYDRSARLDLIDYRDNYLVGEARKLDMAADRAELRLADLRDELKSLQGRIGRAVEEGDGALADQLRGRLPDLERQVAEAHEVGADALARSNRVKDLLQTMRSSGTMDRIRGLREQVDGIEGLQSLPGTYDEWMGVEQRLAQAKAARDRAEKALRSLGTRDLDPGQIAIRSSELDLARAEATRVKNELATLRSSGAASPAELAENKRALDVAERNAAEIERRLADAEEAAEAADSVRAEKASELQIAEDELRIQSSKLEDLEKQQGFAPDAEGNLPPDAGPGSEVPRQVGDWTFKKAMQEMLGLGGQSGDEMAAILQRAKMNLDVAKAKLAAAEDARDETVAQSRTLRAQFDACVEGDG